MKKRFLAALATGLLVVGMGGVAQADPVYEGTYVDMYLKQTTFPDGLEEEMVYLDKSISSEITGHVGGQFDTRLVTISSTTDTLDAANGFATIKAVDGLINDITITAPGFWFEDLIFSLNLVKDTTDVQIMAKDKSGGIDTFGTWLSLDKWINGENNILILSNSGTLMQSVNIQSALGVDSIGGIDQLKHIEISGLTPVPEPATMLLFGTGLAGLAGIARRRKKA